MGQLRGKWLHWAVTGEGFEGYVLRDTLGLHCSIVAASCQAFLLLGYDQGVMSGLVGADNHFGQQFGHPDENMQGICMSRSAEVRDTLWD